jgi:hypothetical protein
MIGELLRMSRVFFTRLWPPLACALPWFASLVQVLVAEQDLARAAAGAQEWDSGGARARDLVGGVCGRGGEGFTASLGGGIGGSN